MNDRDEKDRPWTVPNAICGLRLLALAPLLWVAHRGHREAFLWIVVFLLASDWIDGKLAKLLDQETTFGARFDSAVDALMYVAFALSFWWLEEEVLRRQIGWFLGVAVTWGVSITISLVRLQRLPSYHTRGAKASWLVAGIAALTLLLTGNAGPVPWALGMVILTNLEAAAIGMVLSEWRANVPSLIHAVRLRRQADRQDRENLS